MAMLDPIVEATSQVGADLQCNETVRTPHEVCAAFNKVVSGIGKHWGDNGSIPLLAYGRDEKTAYHVAHSMWANDDSLINRATLVQAASHLAMRLEELVYGKFGLSKRHHIFQDQGGEWCCHIQDTGPHLEEADLKWYGADPGSVAIGTYAWAIETAMINKEDPNYVHFLAALPDAVSADIENFYEDG